MTGIDSGNEEKGAWSSVVGSLAVGKAVGGSIYLHVSAIPASADDLLARAMELADVSDGAFNVVRFGLHRQEVSLLSYPGFFVEAFPLLAQTWSIDFDARRSEHRAYDPAGNPPVLHRKELLLDIDDPLRALFASVTSEAERRGLFTDPAIIGHRVQWEEELRARGARVVGHAILDRDAGDAPEPLVVARHRTALMRRSLSTPVQALWRHGFLDGTRAVFDYGCGRGDDIAALRSRGIEAFGWDPHFRPDAPRTAAHVVNLGFVLNVIEEPEERRHALRAAFALAREMLVVAALIGGRTALESQRLYRDGVFTRASTFQKYFTHPELGAYVAETLGREPISIGPGVYFVFRTDEFEEAFLEQRQRSRVATAAPPPPTPRPSVRPAAPRERTAREPTPRPRKLSKWERHADLLTDLWRACLGLGRVPVDETDFPRLGELKGVLSLGRAVGHLMSMHGADALEIARTRRRGDLAVLFALNLFERRRSFGALSPRLQRDVRELWGSYQAAMEHARALLFSVADATAVEAAAREAAAAQLGHHAPGDAFFFDSALVNDQPPLLRVYVGCAGRLHGDVDQADLVKVHVASGKLSVMTYDDYDCAAIPMLFERVKIDIARRNVRYFQYGREFPPQPLYLRSRHMDPRRPTFDAQCEFDRQLAALDGVDWSGLGPPLDDVLPLCQNLAIPEGLTLPTLRRRRTHPEGGPRGAT